MNEPATPGTDSAIVKRAIEVSIRLVLVFLLLIWGFEILKPFIAPLAWAVILAVALYPLALYLSEKTGLGISRASWLLSLILIAVIIVPTIALATSSVESLKEVATQWNEGTIRIPAPTDKVAEWPLVGEKIHAVWLQASQNLEQTAVHFEDQLKALGSKALGMIASTGITLLMFTFSLIIAGLFMANAEGMTAFMFRFSKRLVGDDGEDFVELATATIRSVAQGVLGVAAIQGTAAAIGLTIMDIPLASLWALAVLMLAIVQLPPLLILLPVSIYAYSTNDTTPATIYLVYNLVVSVSDSFLKPLFLGRGMEVPMLVILLGAIGGMIASGIIGLFIGAVILALIYQLFVAWMNSNTGQAEGGEPAKETAT